MAETKYMSYICNIIFLNKKIYSMLSFVMLQAAAGQNAGLMNILMIVAIIAVF